MDVELYYQEKGSGEPLILLHGNGEDCSYFKNQIEYFQHNFHVIALDTRGARKIAERNSTFYNRAIFVRFVRFYEGSSDFKRSDFGIFGRSEHRHEICCKAS